MPATDVVRPNSSEPMVKVTMLSRMLNECPVRRTSPATKNDITTAATPSTATRKPNS